MAGYDPLPLVASLPAFFAWWEGFLTPDHQANG
jgi:hypothetical protein